MSERGFSLPEGNVLNGKEAFVYMHCHECHTVAGEALPTLDWDGDASQNLRRAGYGDYQSIA